MKDILQAIRIDLGDVIEFDGCLARVAVVETHHDAPPQIHFDDEIDGRSTTRVDVGDVIDIHGLLFKFVDHEDEFVFRSLLWEFVDLHSTGS